MVYGKGYLENSKVKDKNNKKKKSYETWRGMFKRCYKPRGSEIKAYKNCSVCDEWLCFDVFEKWYNENYYEVDNEIMNLDKDILIKNNKTYSPNTCIFVPQSINKLFLRESKSRGDCLIGVSKIKRNSNGDYSYRYKIATNKKLNLNNGRDRIHGCERTELEAFYKYKKIKEEYIRQVADLYKDKIPQKLYDAMYNYQVEITD